jgi:hypothetical protein
MDGQGSEPAQVLDGREAPTPVFDDLNRYQATMHFNGQHTIPLDGVRATGESYCQCARADSNHHGEISPRGPQPPTGRNIGPLASKSSRLRAFPAHIGRIWRRECCHDVATAAGDLPNGHRVGSGPSRVVVSRGKATDGGSRRPG